MSELFKPGDAKRIRWILQNYPWTLGEEICEMLQRFRAEAEQWER